MGVEMGWGWCRNDLEMNNYWHPEVPNHSDRKGVNVFIYLLKKPSFNELKSELLNTTTHFRHSSLFHQVLKKTTHSMFAK